MRIDWLQAEESLLPSFPGAHVSFWIAISSLPGQYYSGPYHVPGPLRVATTARDINSNVVIDYLSKREAEWISGRAER